MIGTVGILNVGAGDTKLSFDKNNPQERIRAARIVRDMLRRGYALLVEVGKNEANGETIYRRATDFDEETCEYIIADFDPEVATEADKAERKNEETVEAAAAPASSEVPPEHPVRRRGRPPNKYKRIDASTVSGVAVSRSAGG